MKQWHTKVLHTTPYIKVEERSKAGEEEEEEEEEEKGCIGGESSEATSQDNSTNSSVVKDYLETSEGHPPGPSPPHLETQ